MTSAATYGQAKIENLHKHAQQTRLRQPRKEASGD